MREGDEPRHGDVAQEPVPAGDQSAGDGPVAARAPDGLLDGDAPGRGDAAPDDAATGAAPAEPPDYHDRWLRAAAELDNVRKRARRDAGLAETRGILRLARELLPSIDNLDRALASAESQPENADHHLTDGIRLVQSEMLSALERVGIVPDSPKGEPFDPHRHEAVAQQPAADGVVAGTVIDVYQPGYRLGEEIVRAAKVVVAA